MTPRILALTAFLMIPHLSLAQNAPDAWDNLRHLRVGQKIEVVDINLKLLKGTFVGFSEESISLRAGNDEVTVQRPDVFRVTDLEHSKRGRHALLGLAIGLGTGFAVGAALDTSELMGGAQGTMKAGLTPLGGVVGAALGAALPSGSRTIYRAKAGTHGGAR